MDADDLCFLPLTELSAGLRRRDYSAVELVTATLSRIDALNASLNAFNLVLADRAMAEAQAADALFAVGRAVHPLHGIPYAIKDIFDLEGVVTTAGSKLLRVNTAVSDAFVTRRLADAGMIAVGKTITVEFARGILGINHIQGTPHNPWHEIPHIPGGSSCGSAVAVAAGLAPMALGSDTGGSVRAPAGLCAAVGLKTTVGRVSRSGVFPISETLDTVGPLTRSVEDCALAYQAMIGEDPRDPSTQGVPSHDVLSTLKGGAAGLRVGIPNDVFLDDLDSDVEVAFDESITVFESLGAQIRRIDVPEAAPAHAAGAFISGAEACVVHERRLDEDVEQMDHVVGPRMLADRNITAVEYIKAVRDARALRESLIRTLGDIDVLLMPTTSRPALPVATVDADPETYMDYSRAYARNTRIGNVLDMCGVSVPGGFTKQGLPIGLLICGKPFDEALVLRAGYAYEQACAWCSRKPDMMWAK
ncbi:MAG: amidase [Pseudomonadota bacterium]